MLRCVGEGAGPDARTLQQRTGSAAEREVVDRLVAQGWQVLATNVRVGRDELDIVALDPGPPAMLVVAEVRFRSRRDFGLPEETVDRRKWWRVWRAASTLLGRGSLPDGSPIPLRPLRIDLIVVEPPSRDKRSPRMRHYRAAEPL